MGLHVLVVEDDVSQAQAMRQMLETADFQTSEAGTLAAAIAHMEAGGQDVILLDLNLPDCQGLDTLTRVLEKDGTAPIVILSGHGDSATADRAVEMGADDYLIKGVVTPQTIRRVLRHAVERFQSRRAAEERAENERALADFGRSALLPLEPQELLERACALAARVMRTRWSAFLRLTEGALFLEAAHNRAADGVTEPVAVTAQTPAALTVRTNEPVVVEDIRTDSRFPPNEFFDRLGIVSVATAVVREGESTAYGVLNAWSDVPLRFDVHQVNFLRALANILAATLQRRGMEEALRASRAELAEILGAIPDRVARVDRDLRILYNNAPEGDANRRFVGARLEEVGIPEPLSTRWKSALNRVFASGAAERFDVESADGASQFDVSVVPVQTDGKTTAVIICRDITERMRAEARFKTLFSAGLIGVVFHHIDGTIRQANDSFLKIAGYTAAEIAGGAVSLADLAPPELILIRPENLRELERRGVIPPHATEIVDRTGSRVPVLMASAAVSGMPGEIASFVLDQRPAQQAQAMIRNQLLLLNTARDAIIVCDVSGSVHFWSDGAARLYGWSAEDAIGSSIFDLVASDANEAKHIYGMAVARGDWRGEVQQLTKERRPLTVDSHCTVVKDPHTGEAACLMINSDITEKKELERQLLQSQRLESLGTLAGGIAHDLNNILMPVLMGTSLLRRSGINPQMEATLGRMDSSIMRAAELIRQMLTFARGHRADNQMANPAELLGEFERILRETFPPNIEIVTEVSPDVWSIACDPTQIHQVLLNLAVNARDAMPDGGTLVVSCHNVDVDEQYARMNGDAAAGSYVMMAVSDTGSGIDPQIMPKIFDPFFTTKGAGSGTGLGLATVRSIVRSHKGFINIYSEPGGTSFKVYLPALHEPRAAINVATREVRAGRGERILVVDDEEAIREITRATLESFGYRVLCAADGSEAIVTYAQNPDIELVLTDMLMPTIDGVATIRALRRINPKIRIISMSGFGVRPGQAVAHAHLVKPFTADEVLRAIEDVLD